METSIVDALLTKRRSCDFDIQSELQGTHGVKGGLHLSCVPCNGGGFSHRRQNRRPEKVFGIGFQKKFGEFFLTLDKGAY